MKIIILTFFFVLGPHAQAQTKQEIIRQISTTATMAGIDSDLAVAIATVESNLNPNAVGALNEQGLFQLRPEYHTTLVGNATHNTLIGIAYLVELKTKFSPKYGSAWFVLFNYGPARRLKRPRETAYYKKVMREIGRIKFQRYFAVRK